jgi:hypothetical protein
VEANVRVYAVDSTIKFGGEVPEWPIDNRPQVNHLPHKVSK